MNSSTLRWAVGALLVVIGTMMLVVPHQFTSIAFTVIRPYLGVWGVAFLVPGICLLAVEVLAPPRFFEIVSHLAAGTALIALAYSFTLMSNWPPVPNYGFLGLGTALTPFIAGTRGRERADGRRDMLPISSGTGAAVLGLAMLLLQGEFTSPVFDSFRPHMTWLGILFLVGGASALYVHLHPTPNRVTFVAGHLLLGGALFAFCLTSAIPLHAWLGIAYYGGFGIVIAMVPWLGRLVRGINPASLETRLAFAFAASVGLPPIVVVSIIRRFVASDSPATNPAWDLSFLLLIAFVVLSTLGGIYIAGHIAAPLGTLSLAARRLAHGDSSARLPESVLTEVQQLAETFGEMRKELAARTEEREKLLAEAEAGKRLLEGLMEHVPEGITIAEGSDVKIRMVSRYGQELLGGAHQDKTAGEVAEHWTVYEADGDTPMAEADLPLVRALLHGETIRDKELIQVDERGRRLWLSCNAAPIRNSQGETTGAIVAWRDISAPKQVEEELRRRAEEVETLMNLAPVAIWVSYDPSCHEITGNRMANSFYEALEGENVSAGPEPGITAGPRRFFKGGRELRAEELPMQEAAARNTEVRDAEFDVLLPSGQWRTLLGSATPLREADGQVRGCIGSFIDITERKRAEEERGRLLATEQEARALAENAVKVRDEFMSIAAHELKTPVTSLMGFSQLLMRQARKNNGQVDTERLLASVERIEEQSRRLTKLTNQLLDLSRLETGKLRLEHEERNLSTLVEDLVSSIRQSHPDRTIEVRAEDVIAHVDALRLEQVLTNLIDNALKFSADDSPVEIAVSKDGDGWSKIEVRDHGIGIPEDKRERVFERFYQAHASQYYGGMGIGLFVCRQIVEMHGGNITIEQPEGKGTRFVVRMPIDDC